MFYANNRGDNEMDKEIRSAEKEFDGFSVRYVLYKRAERIAESDGTRPCFSISVEKRDDKGTEKAYADDITSLESAASRLFELIVRSEVTPVSFTDIIEDII